MSVIATIALPIHVADVVLVRFRVMSPNWQFVRAFQEKGKVPVAWYRDTARAEEGEGMAASLLTVLWRSGSDWMELPDEAGKLEGTFVSHLGKVLVFRERSSPRAESGKPRAVDTARPRSASDAKGRPSKAARTSSAPEGSFPSIFSGQQREP